MQDPRAFQSIRPQFSEQEPLKCPRCGSHNTKFCYYNNYNLSQPRHFCKNCRRYWTRGGTLRNIPVGGGIRKTNKKTNPKRPTSSSSSSSSSTPTAQSTILQTTSAPPPPPSSESIDHDRLMMDMNGSFSSLLASNGHFGGLLESMGMTHSVLEAQQFDAFGRSSSNLNANANANGSSMGELRLEMGDSGSWDATNGWPHLSIYTPGSRFQ